MSRNANDVVNAARAWLGCKESDGSHRKIIDTYNNHKPLARGYALTYDDAWCSAFVSACAIKAGCTDILPTECGCEKHANLFQKLNSWVEDDSYRPKPGDVIFYDWDESGNGDNRGYSDHVGIVETATGDTITIIEGNYGNAVARRTLKVNARFIRGYGVPKYDNVDVKPAEPETPTLKPVAEIAKEVIAGKWGNGDERRLKLYAAGYNPSEVQKRVNELLSGSKPGKVEKDVDTLAREVIAGKWGNGAERKQRLTAAGYDFSEVQKRVNKILG